MLVFNFSARDRKWALKGQAVGISMAMPSCTGASFSMPNKIQESLFSKTDHISRVRILVDILKYYPVAGWDFSDLGVLIDKRHEGM